MCNIICLECGWVGDDSNLEAATEDLDDKDFSYCPDCGGSDFEDEDYDEEEGDE
jgi:hypothetical protein